MSCYYAYLKYGFFAVLFFINLNFYAQYNLDYYASFGEADQHYVHVTLDIKDLDSSQYALVLPVWSPGYYKILDSPKHVVHFEVLDLDGNDIPWFKSTKNKWIVNNGALKNIVVKYKVFANRKSVAESHVSEDKAFIMPNNMFMHLENHIQNQVTLHLKPHPNWSQISTGLKQVDKTTFIADNFDVFYDSPVYLGNQKVITFEHEMKSYSLGIVTPEGLDQAGFVADLKKIISATTSIMKHVPYENYCFIMMEQGGGGLEHWNSQAIFTNGSFLFNSGKSYTDFLNFISHEYFHLYNVKAIRPIELGPFDYSKENYTEMLWVSEGLTVYYEYIIMMKAGLLSGEEALTNLATAMESYENYDGKNHMSLSQSSFDIWLNFFNTDANAKDVTISYYNKGLVMGLLLDLQIRQVTDNKKSLDDVMRYLYNTYYLEKQRGFKKEEFWQACALISGQPLKVLQQYVDSTDAIDYQQYLGFAGLSLEVEASSRKADEEKMKSFKIVPIKSPNAKQLKIRTSLFQI